MSANQLPQGPQTHPWLQQLQWLTRGEEYLKECYQRYGDIFTLRISSDSTPHVFVSNPLAIRDIFAANLKQLDSGKTAGNHPFLLGEQSLVLLSGERHIQQRKLLAPPFHGERIQTLGHTIGQLTEQEVNTWKNNQSFPIYQSLQTISLEVSLRALLGAKDNERDEILKKLLITFLNPNISTLQTIFLHFLFLRWDLGSWSTWGKMIRRKQQIDDIIYAEISKHREQPDSSRTDILSLMIASRYDTGEPMTDTELRDELLTLMTQGPEITVTALVRAFYWILRNPQVLEKLLQELESLGDNLDVKTIIQLPYLDAVYKETLRIYPPPMFAFPRQVKSTLKIQDYQFEAGTILSPCIHLTHHREDLYPQPEQFKPERFLAREFAPYEYFPFGGGNRRCLGAAFAQLEFKIVLATVLSRWELALDDSKLTKVTPKNPLIPPPINNVYILVKGRRA
ncbi:MAG: cytochrome P450 [Scytonema sp. PMC 1069.18]|nr:cytochrome P450 [Scytonema sp. PMC 1069.18]MEC4883850.1 cytochrome P450 [Scytonema sp. PMC 1070.18]